MNGGPIAAEAEIIRSVSTGSGLIRGGICRTIYFLAQGAVTIAGTIDLSGRQGSKTAKVLELLEIGPAIAWREGEAGSDAMNDGSAAGRALDTKYSPAVCEEHRRLLEAFGTAVHELLKLHEQQFLAIVQGDGDSSRFDLLIHMANEAKQQAKYAYIEHVEAHGCSDLDALNQT